VYSSRERVDELGTLWYDILDPEGTIVASLKDFFVVESLLFQLNRSTH
jgi:hypothetical protein